MKRAMTAGAVVLMLALASPAVQAVDIAVQDFNALSDAGIPTFDSLPSGSMLTNSGSMNVGGPGMDFATFWTDTRGEAVGPVTAASDTSDFIGVNSFAGSNSPDVSPTGVLVASGVEHNYEFNDGDGRLDLIFEPVDITGFTSVDLSISYWLNDGTNNYEPTDAMAISLSDGVMNVDIINWDDVTMQANRSADDGTANWLTSTLSDIETLGWTNPDSLVLTVSVDTNASAENVFVDDISFTGVPEPATLALLGMGGVLVIRRRRRA